MGKFTNNILCRTNGGDGRGLITIEVLIDTHKTMCILDQGGLKGLMTQKINFSILFDLVIK